MNPPSTPRGRSASGCAKPDCSGCRHTWTTREQLANAVFANFEGFYNPRRRHSTLDYLSPADYETAWHRQQLAAAA